MRAGVVETLSLLAVAAMLLSAPAVAAPPSAEPAQKPHAAVKANPATHAVAVETVPVAPVGIITDDSISKMGTLTQAQRDAMVKQYAEKLKKMTPAERKAYFDENRRRWDALPPEKKKELQAKMRQASQEYIAAHKAEWDKDIAESKRLNDERTKQFLAKMPAIERAVLEKYRELRKTHSKDYAWHMIIEDAAKGGHLTPLPKQ